MKTVIVRAHKQPEITEIEDNLNSLQEAVEGYIEAVYIKDGYVLVCNEEGKLHGLELNRALYGKDYYGEGSDEPEEMIDIIAGPFLVLKTGEDNFVGLTDAEAQQMYKRFEKPESFFRMLGRIVCGYEQRG